MKTKLYVTLFCGAFAAVSFGNTIYVSPDGAGNKDGTSPENAYAARDCIGKGKTVVTDGDTVKMLPGTYSESATEWYAIQDKAGVAIEGDTANPSSVILDGGNGSVRFFGVEMKNSVRAEVTIRGVTMRNTNSGDNYQSIYVNNSTAYIEDCVFSCITNTGGNGAAIWLANNNSTGEVRRCSFTDCAGPNSSGGAVARKNTSCYFTLYDCAFTNCTAKNAGGAQGVSIVEGCQFVNCTVKDSNGGGAIWDNVEDAEIRGCDFIGCSSGNKKGGAILLTAKAKISGCTFENCTAGGDGGGGAICSGTRLEVDDCTFTKCSSSVGNSGGAIAISGSPAAIRECVFTECSGTGLGGAVFSNVAGSTYTNCTFKNCSSSSTSASGVVYANGNHSFYNCEFVGSTAGGAAAVYFKNSGTYEFTKCKFIDSTSVNSNNGGAMSAGGGTLIVRDCWFEGNQTKATDKHGGAIFVSCQSDISGTTFVSNSVAKGGTSYGGAISFNGGDHTVSNCTFIGCSAYNGGAINCNAASKTYNIFNCSFVGNDSYNAGAGVFANNSATALNIRNCLFSENVTEKSSGSMAVHAKATAAMIDNCTFAGNRAKESAATTAPVYVASGTATVKNCVIWDNLDKGGNLRNVNKASGTTMNVGNLASDGTLPTGEGLVALSASPFVDAANGDYTLAKKVDDGNGGRVANPCLGAGVKLDWMTAESLDLAGHPRLRETDIVDLGCYSYSDPAASSGLLIFVR